MQKQALRTSPHASKDRRQYETTRAWSQFKMIASKKRTTTHVLTPCVGLFRILAAPGALKQELVFALLAVDGRRP